MCKISVVGCLLSVSGLVAAQILQFPQGEFPLTDYQNHLFPLMKFSRVGHLVMAFLPVTRLNPLIPTAQRLGCRIRSPLSR
ncbi:MAG: hypothetical protein ACJA0Z_003622 [Halioglobus sp.]|jgi:hypothetical protein